LQERIQQFEDEIDRLANENTDFNVRQQELFATLESSEKTSLRLICDCIKKLLMAIDSPSHVYSTIP